MRSFLRSYRGWVAAFAIVLVALALGAVLQVGEEPVAESTLQVAGHGPPSCLGYSLGDPCINRQNLGQCRAAVAQCKDEPVAVIETCPLQFRCGR